jgi:hypothetical protein
MRQTRPNFRAAVRRNKVAGRMFGQTFATAGALARSDAADAKLAADRREADEEAFEAHITELCSRNPCM